MGTTTHVEFETTHSDELTEIEVGRGEGFAFIPGELVQAVREGFAPEITITRATVYNNEEETSITDEQAALTFAFLLGIATAKLAWVSPDPLDPPFTGAVDDGSLED